MNVSLTPALEKFVQDKVASGLYNSVSEVIREALRLLISQESVSKERLVMLNQDIKQGLDDNDIQDCDSALNNLVKKYE
ncbi:type II toxin-antitoxin system ParD family antitoxin [bacterium]|nr:type II toxin-antitoxin system ParD family antitoxin [bacterium]